MRKHLLSIVALTGALTASAQTLGLNPTGPDPLKQDSLVRQLLGRDPSDFKIDIEPPFSNGLAIRYAPDIPMTLRLSGESGSQTLSLSELDDQFNVKQDRPFIVGDGVKWSSSTGRETYLKPIVLWKKDNGSYTVPVSKTIVFNPVDGTSKDYPSFSIGFEDGANASEASISIFDMSRWGDFRSASQTMVSHRATRQQVFDHFVAVAASDYDRDGMEDAYVFFDNKVGVLAVDGSQNESIQRKSVSGFTTFDIAQIPHANANSPVTWSAISYDVDENGVGDVIALASYLDDRLDLRYALVYIPNGDVQRMSCNSLSTDQSYYFGFKPVADIAVFCPDGKYNGYPQLAIACHLLSPDWADKSSVMRYVYMLPLENVALGNVSLTRNELLMDSTITTGTYRYIFPSLGVTYLNGEDQAPYLSLSDGLWKVNLQNKSAENRLALSSIQISGKGSNLQMIAAPVGMKLAPEGAAEVGMFGNQQIVYFLANAKPGDGENIAMAVIGSDEDGKLTYKTSQCSSIDEPFYMTSRPSAADAVVKFRRAYFTATNPTIKYLLGVPPYDDTIDRSQSMAPKMAWSQLQLAENQGHSDSRTDSKVMEVAVNSGIKLFGVLKVGADYGYNKTWTETTSQAHSCTQSYGYTANQRQNGVVFNYLPVYAFEYDIEGVGLEDGQSKTLTIYRMRRSADGRLPEALWTQETYNRYVSGTGKMLIGQDIFTHKVGSLDNYRRCKSTDTEEDIKAMFPVKKDGLFILGKIVTTGDGGSVQSSISLSDSKNVGSGGSYTHKGGVSVGFSVAGVPFSVGGSAKYGQGESWSVTNTWSSTTTMSGSVPYTPIGHEYSFRQVWYEYYDSITNQDFMVTDYVLVDYAPKKKPVSVNIEITESTGAVQIGDDWFFANRIHWNIKNIDKALIAKCELYYKVSGLTPTRRYDVDGGLVEMIPEQKEDWFLLPKTFKYTRDEKGKVHEEGWMPIEHAYNPLTGTWEVIDWFRMNNDQFQDLVLRNYLRDVIISYKVKVYFIDGTELEDLTISPDLIEIYDSPEAGNVLIPGSTEVSGIEVINPDNDANGLDSDPESLSNPNSQYNPIKAGQYNLNGVPVSKDYKGVMIINGQKVLNRRQ